MTYEIDVHGLTLNEAQKRIMKEIEIAYNLKHLSLSIIHGSNNGFTIGSWLRTSRQLLNNRYVNSIVPSTSNNGITIINIKIKPF